MRNYAIADLPDYFKQYKKSIKNPKKFWDKIADENFIWYQRWTKVVEFDMEEAKIKWFKNAFFIEFERPQSAMAEGQFAAWYDGDELLGSGVIS